METSAVKYIVVHCSATMADQDIGADVIRRWHVEERGWSDIGYHAVIRRDGTVEPGRSLDMSALPGWQPRQGAHVERHNHESVAVCLVGGLDRNGRPEENFTVEQLNALRDLLTDWKRRFPQAEILGHRDFPGVAKACPCFDVRDWLGRPGFNGRQS